GGIITPAMEPILADARVALRRLWRAPGFALFAVVSLAVGIGVSTAIYSAVRTLLWMPLGVPDEQALVAVSSHRVRNLAMSWVDFQDFRVRQTSAAALAAETQVRSALSVGRSSRAVFGEAVSGGYFATIGVTPRLGRLIDATDEAAAAHVVVISEGFWRAALDRDPAAVGRTVRLGGSAFEVVGVVSGHFHGLDRFVPATFWVPATALRNNPERFELSRSAFDRRGQGAFAVWGRLVPGVPVTRFASEVAVIG